MYIIEVVTLRCCGNSGFQWAGLVVNVKYLPVFLTRLEKGSRDT